MLAQLCFHFQSSFIFLKGDFFFLRPICSIEVATQHITRLTHNKLFDSRQFLMLQVVYTEKSELVVLFISHYRTQDHCFEGYFPYEKATYAIISFIGLFYSYLRNLKPYF